MLVKLNWNFVGETLSILAVHTDQVLSNSSKVFPVNAFLLTSKFHKCCYNVDNMFKIPSSFSGILR